MLVIPAIDLRDGGVEELTGVDSSQTEVRFGDPRDVARRWAGYGFHRLHVTDLDAEAGRGSNSAIVTDLLLDAAAPIQIGGGVRKKDDVDQLISDGAAYVIVGADALDDFDWLRDVVDAHPANIVLSTTIRDRRVVTRDQSRGMPRDILDLVHDLAELPLGGLVVSAIRGDSALARKDLQLLEDIADASACAVIAAGAIGSMTDLRALEERGVAAAIVGAALYSGALDPRIHTEEFAA